MGGLDSSSDSNDGYHDGDYLEQSITVSNTAPTVSSVSIAPGTGLYNDTVVTCTATATDIDQTVTPVTPGMSTGQPTGATLDLSTTGVMPNDTVMCTATVTDTQGASASDSASATVENRAPAWVL